LAFCQLWIAKVLKKNAGIFFSIILIMFDNIVFNISSSHFFPVFNISSSHFFPFLSFKNSVYNMWIIHTILDNVRPSNFLLSCSVLSTISFLDPYRFVHDIVSGSVSRDRWCGRFVWLFPGKECLEVFNSPKSWSCMICSTLTITSLTTADTAGGNGGTRELPASCTLPMDSCKMSQNAEKSHTGHCIRPLESTKAKVQNIQYRKLSHVS
jgi:hypothetical protein